MPMDAVFLHGLTQELTQSLTGARIDKVQQPERDLLLLSVRTQSGNARLLVHGGVGSARVHFTRGTFENPAEPPMFCMLLRKHLVGARITDISQPDFERMLVLDLDGRDELGTPVRKQLVVEMLGRQSNVILVSGDGHIIDCMRRVDSSMSETRQVQPGLFYRLPLRQDKPVLFDTTPEQRTQLLSGPVTAATLDKWLLGLFSGVSPLLCREVCFRALGDASPRLERLDDAGIAENTVICLTADHNPYMMTAENLKELTGHEVDQTFEVYKNACLLYCKGMTPETVDEPCCAMDLLPTLSNLFGLDFDSRLYMGRDIFSDAPPLVIFLDRSWITDKCMYNANTGEVTSLDGSEISDDYVEQIKNEVYNKFTVSTRILDYDYWNILFGDEKN